MLCQVALHGRDQKTPNPSALVGATYQDDLRPMWQAIVLQGLGHAVQDFLLAHQLA